MCQGPRCTRLQLLHAALCFQGRSRTCSAAVSVTNCVIGCVSTGSDSSSGLMCGGSAARLRSSSLTALACALVGTWTAAAARQAQQHCSSSRRAAAATTLPGSPSWVRCNSAPARTSPVSSSHSRPSGSGSPPGCAAGSVACGAVGPAAAAASAPSGRRKQRPRHQLLRLRSAGWPGLAATAAAPSVAAPAVRGWSGP